VSCFVIKGQRADRMLNTDLAGLMLRAAPQVFSTDRHPNSLGPCPDDPLDAG
jgi:hypothetical protein